MTTTNYTDEQRANVARLCARIDAATKTVLDSDPSEKDRAVALLLSNVGGFIEYAVKHSQPIGLIGNRAQRLVKILEAEQEVRPTRADQIRRQIETLKARTGVGDDHPMVKRLIDRLNEQR